MFKRSYLALDIAADELRGVALHRKAKGVALAGGRVLPLAPAEFTPSLREPNIREPRRFVEAVRKVLGPLAGREERIALSLPDSAGRVLLTETEVPFKSKREGMEILKWQLKSALPAAYGEVRLDYQVLKKNETGRSVLAVAIIAHQVLHQYEELLGEAGYHAAVVDFHSLHLYNYYRPRLDLGEDFILVVAAGGALSLQFFQGRILAFHRTREVPASASAVFQELSRAVVGCRENFPAFRRAALFLHSDWPERLSLAEAVSAAFEHGEVAELSPHLERLAAPTVRLAPENLFSLTAAVGAAERFL